MSEVDRFDQAHRNEQQLNSRQREVLDLLVAGKTNGEIGEALGMTLDGAKWNVGEILGKLGLSSREEAAEYWRWRRRPAGRVAALRGLFSMSALKWVAGGAATIGAVAVLAAFFSSAEDRQSGELPPFYLEARVEIEDASRTVGTDIARGSAEMEFEHRTSTLKWWQTDREHTRWEVENSTEWGSSRTVILADGTREWTYSDETNTYSTRPQAPLPADVRVRGAAMSLLIGPAFTADLHEFLTALEGWAGDGGGVERLGTEMVLGRHTVVYQLTPAAKSSTGRPGPNGESVETENGKGTARLWLDEERMVVMRYIAQSDVTDVDAEVVVFDYDITIPQSTFRFIAPAGATEADENTVGEAVGIGSSGQRGHRVGYEVPAGYLEIPGEPAGFEPYSWSRRTLADVVTEFELELARDDGPSEVVVTQRLAPQGLPPSLLDGDDVTVDGVPGKRIKAGDRIRLAFMQGELAVVITGSSVTFEDLLAIAESLEQVP